MEIEWTMAIFCIEELARGRSLSAEETTATGAKAQLLGAAPYPGPRKTPVFFVGGFLAENRRAWEIISRSFQPLSRRALFRRFGWICMGFGWIWVDFPCIFMNFHEFSKVLKGFSGVFPDPKGTWTANPRSSCGTRTSWGPWGAWRRPWRATSESYGSTELANRRSLFMSVY